MEKSSQICFNSKTSKMRPENDKQPFGELKHNGMFILHSYNHCKRIDRKSIQGRQHRLDRKIFETPLTTNRNGQVIKTKKWAQHANMSKFKSRHHNSNDQHYHTRRMNRQNSCIHFKTSLVNRDRKNKQITDVLIAAAAAAVAESSTSPNTAMQFEQSPNQVISSTNKICSNSTFKLMENRNQKDIHELVRFNPAAFRCINSTSPNHAKFLLKNDSNMSLVAKPTTRNYIGASRMSSYRVQKVYRRTSSRLNCIRRRRQIQINRLQRLTSILNMRRQNNFRFSTDGSKRIRSSPIDYSTSSRYRKGRKNCNAYSSSFSLSLPSSSQVSDEENDIRLRNSKSLKKQRTYSINDDTSHTMNTSSSSSSSYSGSSSSSDCATSNESSTSLSSDSDLDTSNLADCLGLTNLNSGMEDNNKESNETYMNSTIFACQKKQAKFFLHKKRSSTSPSKKKLKKKRKKSTIYNNGGNPRYNRNSMAASTSNGSFKFDVVQSKTGYQNVLRSKSLASRPSRRCIFSTSTALENLKLDSGQGFFVSKQQKKMMISSLSTSSIKFSHNNATPISSKMKQSITNTKRLSIIESLKHSFDSMYNFKGSNIELDDLQTSSLNSSLNTNNESSSLHFTSLSQQDDLENDDQCDAANIKRKRELSNKFLYINKAKLTKTYQVQNLDKELDDESEQPARDNITDLSNDNDDNIFFRTRDIKAMSSSNFKEDDTMSHSLFKSLDYCKPTKMKEDLAVLSSDDTNEADEEDEVDDEYVYDENYHNIVTTNQINKNRRKMVLVNKQQNFASKLKKNSSRLRTSTLVATDDDEMNNYGSVVSRHLLPTSYDDEEADDEQSDWPANEKSSVPTQFCMHRNNE